MKKLITLEGGERGNVAFLEGVVTLGVQTECGLLPFAGNRDVRCLGEPAAWPYTEVTPIC